MSELALRAGAYPMDVDWTAWREAGIERVQVSAGSEPELLEALRAAGLRLGYQVSAFRGDGEGAPLTNGLGEEDPLWRYPSDEAVGKIEGAPADEIVLTELRFGSALEEAVGTRWGEAVVCELDAWAASIDVGDRARAATAAAGGEPEAVTLGLQRYLAGRLDGSVLAELPASGSGIGLLLGEDREPVLAARLETVASVAAKIVARARPSRVRVSVVTDGPAVERRALIEALRDVVDSVVLHLGGSLLEVRRAAESHISAAGEAAACILPVPSAAIPDPERLADALDILEGIGIQRITLETNPAWVSIGAETVARAAHRLRGRAGPVAQLPARRRELDTV